MCFDQVMLRNILVQQELVKFHLRIVSSFRRKEVLRYCPYCEGFCVVQILVRGPNFN